MTLHECYSQHKDEIVLVFTSTHKELFIKAQLDGATSLLSFHEDLKRAKKNSVNLFPILEGNKVESIHQFLNERAFSIDFGENQLLFKLYGRSANVVLCHKGMAQESFRSSMTGDLNVKLEELDRTIDQSEENLIATEFDLKSIFPTFGKRVLEFISNQGFAEMNNSDKTSTLSELTQRMETSGFFIYEETGLPYLTLLEEEEKESLYHSKDSMEASNTFARFYSYSFHLKKEKNLVEGKIKNGLKKHNSYVKKLSMRMTDIQNTPKHEEIANILMANLHLQRPGLSSIELFDFYRDQNITIKIKSDRTLQKNAENFYRKGKNQSIELDNLQKNVKAKNKLIEEADESLIKLASIKDIKTLRQEFKVHLTSKGSKQEEPSKPYIEFIVHPYKVLVGKNAKSNDIMLQRHTSKNDLWLHARNVSGSHVIIKELPGREYPKDIIEKAAQLAAWYSKGKTDTLCPVIYTPRKYVRKPKGALPGQVILQQEEVIIVKPYQKVQ